MAAKPILTTGVALATATAIVAATPAILPNATEKTYVTTTSAPAGMDLRELTVEDYRLMAITFPGLLQAFFNGYGQEVTEDTLVLGPLGALYYLLDEGVLAAVDVDDHFFERGPYAAAGHLAREAGFEEFGEFLEGPWEDLRESFIEAVNRLTGGTGDLDDEDTELTFAAKLVQGFLFNGGPLGVIRVIVDEIKQAFDPEPEAEALTFNDPAAGQQALLGESKLPAPEGPQVARFGAGPAPGPAQKVDVVDPGAAGLNPGAGLKIPSFLPEKGETAGLGGLANAIKNFEIPGAPQPAPPQPVVEAEAAGGEEAPTTSAAELRREALAERLQERREAAKERREALKDRVDDVKDKVKNVVERATGNTDKNDNNDQDDTAKNDDDNDTE
ncbi:hypothetical protein [[Mycobacterium] wendilense]|uniref:PE-PPE domain-containing protein n=1 Tax=[Mycobacterium] wendilense TaxID=3064284 RepID=A0ABM9MA51_9MYCO|nr:hypothetical protein [Mycolicibacterium sp. MU0050]CAJ1580202.1 hypothetical protein MU0050_000896 [Mycolicibacterium sp. MU0050]